MALSARLRFEILRRDRFRCRYCGATAADTRLHVDHVYPRALGGTDDDTNLVTACQLCNLGKSDTDLDEPPAQQPQMPIESASDAWFRAALRDVFPSMDGV